MRQQYHSCSSALMAVMMPRTSSHDLTVRYNIVASQPLPERSSLLYFFEVPSTRNLCCTYLSCPGASQWLCFWLMEMVVPSSALFAFCKTCALPAASAPVKRMRRLLFLLLVSVSLWTQPQEDFYFSSFFWAARWENGLLVPPFFS